MTLAPIVIFTYNRPKHTQQTVEALLQNEFATESDLIIYSDGYKDEKSREGVEETRKYIHSITGFKSLRIIERDKNWGLANSIIDGVTNIVNEYGRIIVLEDDLLTSPYFLKFMNDGLNRYEQDDKVVSVHGYVYPIKKELPENFFLCHTDSFGWGTWKDSWTIFNPDGQFLLENLQQKNLISAFNFNNSYNFYRMLRYQVERKNNSWAIRWYASAFLAGKLSLFPNKSLIYHDGNDPSATHNNYGDEDWLSVELSDTPVNLIDIPVEENKQVRVVYEKFFRHYHNLWKKLKRKLKNIFTKIFTS